jgi:hypothetical protein
VTARSFAFLTAGLTGLTLLAGPLAQNAFAAPTPSATPIAVIATPTAGSSTVGLFGSADPSFDGVYRQSLSILALTATGHQPNASAVNWLLTQQCADGGFEADRANTAVACAKGGEDENATALAIGALVAIGRPITTAVTALKAFQLPDGGFYESTAFGPAASDADSTGLAMSALVAAGIDPTTVTAASGKNAVDFLRTLQLACAATSGGGAFDFQPEASLHANDLATVQATLGLLGKALPVAVAATTGAVPTCPATITDAPSAAAAALSYLSARLVASSGAIPSSFGSGADWTSTANAAIDLVAAGTGSAAVTAAVDALQANAAAYVGKAGAYAPGSLATLILLAHATGSDPTAFGGIDLVPALASTVALGVTVRDTVREPVGWPIPADDRYRHVAARLAGDLPGRSRCRRARRRPIGGPTADVTPRNVGVTVAVLLTLAIATFLSTGRQAQAASGYRYWAYFLGAGGSWQYSQRGPATDYPTDGQVQGWRFAVQADAATLAPRTPPIFGQLCAKTAAASGHIRVGIVLDFGVAADAPAGDHPPAAPIDGCVLVPTGSSGIVVLDAAVGSAEVRIGTGADVGLVCGIAGYPKTECAEAVDGAPTHPATTTTAQPIPPPTHHVRPTPVPVRPTATPTPRPTTTQHHVDPSAIASSQVPENSTTAPISSSPAPSALVTSPSQSAAPALPLSALRPAHQKRRLPVSAIVGGLVVVALAVGGWLRLRRTTP